jgi:hypothetical protein
MPRSHLSSVAKSFVPGLALGLAALAPAGCGIGGSGSLSCPSNGKVPVEIRSEISAKAALETGRAVATETFGAPAKWLGGMAGVSIDRDGTPKEGALVTGWAFTFCNGLDQIGFSVGPPQSSGECVSNAVDCSKVTEPPAFEIDSKRLLEIAFPNDGADATYSMQLTLLTSPTWTIHNIATNVTVKVDPQTGAIVP